jgi:hypothetical protein
MKIENNAYAENTLTRTVKYGGGSFVLYQVPGHVGQIPGWLCQEAETWPQDNNPKQRNQLRTGN